MDKDRRKRFLGGMTTDQLRHTHWLISRELVARGEEVALLYRSPVEEEIGTWGRPHTSLWLPGLAWEMFRRGLSASEVARRTGMRVKTVADAMAGRHRTREETARRIADALDVDLEDLRRPPLEMQVLEATSAPETDGRNSGEIGAA